MGLVSGDVRSWNWSLMGPRFCRGWMPAGGPGGCENWPVRLDQALPALWFPGSKFNCVWPGQQKVHLGRCPLPEWSEFCYGPNTAKASIGLNQGKDRRVSDLLPGISDDVHPARVHCTPGREVPGNSRIVCSCLHVMNLPGGCLSPGNKCLVCLDKWGSWSLEGQTGPSGGGPTQHLPGSTGQHLWYHTWSQGPSDIDAQPGGSTSAGHLGPEYICVPVNHLTSKHSLSCHYQPAVSRCTGHLCEQPCNNAYPPRGHG